MTWKWSNVAPFGIPPWWENLESTNHVEEDSDASKVRMWSQSSTLIIHWLRWCFDKPYLITTNAVDSVEIRQQCGWKL